MTVEQMAKTVGDLALLAVVSLQAGNVILLYQSSSKASCLAGAVGSILTEVGGKVYTTTFTRMAMKDLLNANSSSKSGKASRKNSRKR